MKPNDETTYQTQGQIGEKKKSAAKSSWQKVTIGGVTGILIGAGATHIGNAYAEETDIPNENDSATQPTTSHTSDNGLRVAEVDQDLSFGEAFAAARAEVGAGGVFHWHGRTYNTYTESEWENMSDAEHTQFAQQVAPEIQSSEVQSEQHLSTAQHHETHHEQQEDVSQQPQVRQVSESQGEEQDEPEVHFLGVDQVQTDSGQTINVGHMTIAEEEVALVDMDNDMIFDVAVSDRNHNDQIDEGEVIDISDRQLTVTDFALAAEEENGNGESAQPDFVSNPQDQLAEDMPDYMNDADIEIV